MNDAAKGGLTFAAVLAAAGLAVLLPKTPASTLRTAAPQTITLLPGESVTIVAVKPDTVVPPIDTVIPPKDSVPPPVGIKGIPMGPFALDLNSPASFSFAVVPSSPGSIVGQINKARAAKVRIAPALCGGGHSKYLTGGKFDKAIWKRCIETYNRADVKAAVAQGVKDGTLAFNTMIDEANHKTWGGVFTANPGIIDELSRYSKAVLPTLPTGLVIQVGWHPEYRYTDTDYLIHQFSYTISDPGAGSSASGGDPALYRDRALKEDRTHGTTTVWSMNIINGGKRVAGCVKGQTPPNCRMTPAEIEVAADKLTAKGGAGLLFWQQNSGYPFTAPYQAAFQRVAATLKTRAQ